MRKNRYGRKKNHRGRAEGYKSGFEKDIGDFLKSIKKKQKIKFSYETMKIAYTIPRSLHTYTPDWIIVLPNKEILIIETKGRFVTKDRQKHLLIQEQFPDLDIRFIFGRDQKINKNSKTLYSDWCKKNGFLYHIGKEVPLVWLIQQDENKKQ
jgi:hypothetical protein|tara:strand:- start:798 stop:1253 length:456 start_codon:yes stop_codon:yes gene_type:complete